MPRQPDGRFLLQPLPDHADNGRHDLRRRRKCLGRNITVLDHAVLSLKHDRKPAVGFRSRGGDHSVDHFLLKHKMLIYDAVADFGELKEERRRNVVGQIADHADLFFRGEVSPVELQGVSLKNG